MSSLKPVRTREDSHSWLTIGEVEEEVFAAFVGARSHARNWDFNKDAKEMGPDCELQPDTVVQANGHVWHDRSDFLSYLSAGIVWRLEALAKRKGVDLADFDVAGYLGAHNCKCLESVPYFKYLGGEVHTVTADQLTPAQRKAIKAGKPVTVSKGTIDGL